MKTFTDKEQSRLIKQFHSMLTRAGFDDDDKATILSKFGVMSTKDLSCSQLIECCNYLQELQNPKAVELDAYRKRVIKAVNDYLHAINSERTDIDYIKAIACRAAGCDNFNRIPLTQLRGIYTAFCKQTKALRSAEQEAQSLSVEQDKQFIKIMTNLKVQGNA